MHGLNSVLRWAPNLSRDHRAAHTLAVFKMVRTRESLAYGLLAEDVPQLLTVTRIVSAREYFYVYFQTCIVKFRVDIGS